MKPSGVCGFMAFAPSVRALDAFVCELEEFDDHFVALAGEIGVVVLRRPRRADEEARCALPRLVLHDDSDVLAIVLDEALRDRLVPIQKVERSRAGGESA